MDVIDCRFSKYSTTKREHIGTMQIFHLVYLLVLLLIFIFIMHSHFGFSLCISGVKVTF